MVTCEVAGPGHPDKIADQIADAVVDEVLVQDPLGRCGCEVLVNAQFIVVAGQLKTTAQVDAAAIARRVISEIGYTRPELGFTADDCAMITSFRQQSPEIAAVIEKDGSGASDQGVMYGYACDETPELLPLPLQLARRLSVALTDARRGGALSYLRPDTKTQVTAEYGSDGEPSRVSSVVLAAQHDPEVEVETLRRDLLEHVLSPTLPPELVDDRIVYTINQLGRFILGGPAIDTGMTGRKIISDTYGGVARIGGGALSGKDPTKLDRTGAYYGRYVAKNIVAAGLASVCELSVAYAFGTVDPVATTVETFGSGLLPEDELVDVIGRHFDFRPAAMIEQLSLQRPIYGRTAANGHFGDPEYPWERTDMAERIRAYAKVS